MTLNDYQVLAMRTSPNDGHSRIENGCMGLCGESGECIDILKKHLMQGHMFDAEKLAEELGDVLWYVAELATGLDMTLEAIARKNIEKLKNRYPEGFDPEKSIHRNE